MAKKPVADWKVIENDREKYAAYLCSREWAERREAVRKRAKGSCERCTILPMEACHHLTYERKYAENLEDLQATCNPCHEFTHGKSAFDPKPNRQWVRYLRSCSNEGGLLPVPWYVMDTNLWVPACSEFVGFIESINSLAGLRRSYNIAANIELLAISGEDENWSSCIPAVVYSVESVMRYADSMLPWNYASWVNHGRPRPSPADYDLSLALFGFPAGEELHNTMYKEPRETPEETGGVPLP